MHKNWQLFKRNQSTDEWNISKHPYRCCALCSCLSLLTKVIKKIKKSYLYVNFKFGSWLKILKLGSITFFGECSHRNRDRRNILFRSHWLHSSTSYRPSILQGPEGVKFIILPETIPTGRLYLRSGHLFLNTWHEVGKCLSLFFPQTEKKWMWIFFEETYWPHFRYL